MNRITHMQKAAECWECFKNDHIDSEYKKFFDVFSHVLLHEKNKKKLVIKVGEKCHDGFLSFLTAVHNDFDFCKTCFDEDPQLFIKNKADRINTTIALINLTAMKNLSVKVVEQDDVTFDRYTINFNYMDSIDYEIDIVIWKE